MENQQRGIPAGDELMGAYEAENPLQTVNQVLGELKTWLTNYLPGAEHVHIRIRLANQLDQMRGFLTGIAGVISPAGHPDAPALGLADLNQPITVMFGVPVNRPMAVRPDDLIAGAQERDDFIRRRDAVRDEFLNQTDQDLLRRAGQPGGDALIRAVAKSAGHEEWKEAPMDVVFIQETRSLLLDRKHVVDAEKLANTAAIQPGAPDATGNAGAGEDNDLDGPLHQVTGGASTSQALPGGPLGTFHKAPGAPEDFEAGSGTTSTGGGASTTDAGKGAAPKQTGGSHKGGAAKK